MRVVFITSVVLGVLAAAGDALALDVTAASGESADIQAAVDQVAADGGGTVFLPEGEFSMTDTVDMPGGISVIGAGSDKTILDCQPSACFVINHPGDQGGAFRFSGVSFVGIGGNAIKVYNIEDFRIDHCEFHAESNAYALDIKNRYGFPESTGVIDHCSFYTPGDAYCVHVSPQPWPDEEGRLEHLGTGHNVFIEDCYFERPYHAVASFNGSHYVLRHSTLVNSTSGVDAHGPGYEYLLSEPEPEQYRGGRCAEIYDNVFESDASTDTWGPIKLRSGGGVIFNNSMRSSDYAVIFVLENGSYEASGGVYPGLDQIHDMWLWDNTTEDLRNGLLLRNGAHAEEFIQENRDYFLRAPSAELDGFDYEPYPYPHPLVTGEGGSSGGAGTAGGDPGTAGGDPGGVGGDGLGALDGSGSDDEQAAGCACRTAAPRPSRGSLVFGLLLVACAVACRRRA